MIEYVLQYNQLELLKYISKDLKIDVSNPEIIYKLVENHKLCCLKHDCMKPILLYLIKQYKSINDKQIKLLVSCDDFDLFKRLIGIYGKFLL